MSKRVKQYLLRVRPISFKLASGSVENILSKEYDDGSSFIAYFLPGTNNLYHRSDGPAVQWFKDGKSYCELYFLLGNKVTEEEFKTPGFVDAYILEHS